MSELLNTLLDMGFEKERAELAAKKSSNLDSAIDWLEKNQSKSTEELLEANASDEPTSSTSDAPPTARSLKCDDCGKVFRDQSSAEYHANKSGHENFSESTEEVKPLTEEEKQARLAELRDKAAARKALKDDEEKLERKKNEEIRRKATQHTQDLKEELQKKEQIKEAEKKRREKKEDEDAKKRILAKIEADKADRRAKAEAAKAAREGRSIEEPAPVVPSAAAAAATPKTNTHTQARLRLSTPNGNVMKTFPAEMTLFEVAHTLAQESGITVSSFEITFPRKTFTNTEFGMTLKEAGLVPSAVLNVR